MSKGPHPRPATNVASASAPLPGPAAPPAPVPPLLRFLHAVSALITLIGNLIPLYGVLYLDWDTFQLLMLYWMETLIIAVWTIGRLAKLPAESLGTMKVNGVVKPATNRMLVGFFSVHAGAFTFAHLFFLWALFGREWLARAHPGGVVGELLSTNGVWIALLFMFVASFIAFLIDTKPAAL
jgi:Family of unknown function (DUF6498)